MDLAITLGTSLVTLVLGLVGGVWLTEFVRRPRLRQSGAGGGGGLSHLTFTNEPGFIGIHVPPTVLFGRSVHKDCRKGVAIERNGTDCTASLHDPDHPGGGIGLWMRDPNAPDRPSSSARIDGSQQVQVMLFGYRRQDGNKFYVFAPDETDPWQSRVPPDSEKLNAPKTLMLRIHYGGGEILEVPITVAQNLQGQMLLSTPTTGLGL